MHSHVFSKLHVNETLKLCSQRYGGEICREIAQNVPVGIDDPVINARVDRQVFDEYLFESRPVVATLNRAVLRKSKHFFGGQQPSAAFLFRSSPDSKRYYGTTSIYRVAQQLTNTLVLQCLEV